MRVLRFSSFFAYLPTNGQPFGFSWAGKECHWFPFASSCFPYLALQPIKKKEERKIGRHKRQRINNCLLAETFKRAAIGQCMLQRRHQSCQELPRLLKDSAERRRNTCMWEANCCSTSAPMLRGPGSWMRHTKGPVYAVCVLWLTARLYFPKALLWYFSQVLQSHILNSYVGMGRRNTKNILISCRRVWGLE